MILCLLGLFVASVSGMAEVSPASGAAREPRVAAAKPRPFDLDDWRAVTSDRSHARVIVFTTQDCAYCAQEVRRIAAALRERGADRVALQVIALDGRESALELAASGQYDAATRIDYVAGDEQRLRYAVNPRWRGETPYVALIPRDGAIRFALGHASAVDLDAMTGG